MVTCRYMSHPGLTEIQRLSSLQIGLFDPGLEMIAYVRTTPIHTRYFGFTSDESAGMGVQILLALLLQSSFPPFSAKEVDSSVD